MTKPTKQLTLEADRWYAWEMLPGYSGGRYYSPILVHSVKSLKTGRNILRLDFYNACYAEGVRDFSLKLQILHRGQEYILSKLVYDGERDLDRCAIIRVITISWLLSHFPKLEDHPLITQPHHAVRVEAILEELF